MASSIYRVTCDMDNFQSLEVVDPVVRASEALDLDGHPRGAIWPTPTVGVVNADKPRGDFMALGAPHLLVIRRSHPLALFLDRAGEVLPLRLPGGPGDLVVMNLKECMNMLDVNKSQYQPTGQREQLRVSRYVFHANRGTESSVFSEYRTRLSEVLCREATRQYSYPEGQGDDGSEFKAAYEYHRATGLKFELLWEG